MIQLRTIHLDKAELAFRDREGPTLAAQTTIRELIDEGSSRCRGRVGVCAVTH